VGSPGIWEAVFGFAKGSAWFPYTSPAIFSMPAAFLAAWLFSITDKSKSAMAERAAFEAQYVRQQTGIGAEGAAAH
jgi:cation/acetate symporter